jgi:putative ABC transport system permease protein
MRDLLWRVVLWRLARRLPPSSASAALGDLEEDYGRQLASTGRLRADLWLIREARSLDRAYRRQYWFKPGIAESKGHSTVGDDVRHAWRRIAAHPARALPCIALLALGIGLATAMFSVVDSVMFRPAPFPDPEQLVEVGFSRAEPDVMEAWRATGMFQAVESARTASFQTADSATGTWPGALVTPGIFEMLGARALFGRLFSAADAVPGSDAVLLSETIWRAAFGADRSLPGRRITLGGASLVVVGILPATFRFPSPATSVWRPFDPARDESPRTGVTKVIGRLKPGVPWSDVETRTAAISRALARLPSNYLGSPPLRLVGRTDQLDSFTRQALWLLLCGVGLVFIVLCANVSSLRLAHLAGRRREFAVCSALGASRSRLMRQATVEHALLAAAGASAGIGLAWVLTAIVPDLFIDRTLNPVDVDPRALGAAVALGVAAVLLSGLLPAWTGTRSDPADAVRGSRDGGTDTRRARLATRGLLVAEVALACSLLVGSALLARSFANLVHADRGLQMDGAVHVSVSGLDLALSASREAHALGLDAIAAMVKAWPEVEASALAREIPPTWDTGTVYLGPPRSLDRGARPSPSASEAELTAWVTAMQALGTTTDINRVSPEFFSLYGIRILRGRALQPGDGDLEAVVGERLASLLWPDADPIGQLFTVGRTAGYRVIGIASEIRLPTLDAALDRPEFYVPLGTRSGSLRLILRCRTECPAAATMESRLQAVHPALRARTITTAENTYLAQLRLPRAIAQMGGVFAAVAVLTAAGGLFSVMTYAVGRRRREFGIRAALGAAPGQLRGLVFREGFALVAAGVIAGGLGGWMVARGLASFQYGVSAWDPIVWIGALGTIALTSLAASWRPARQAMRVNPVKLLREE